VTPWFSRKKEPSQFYPFLMGMVLCAVVFYLGYAGVKWVSHKKFEALVFGFVSMPYAIALYGLIKNKRWALYFTLALALIDVPVSRILFGAFGSTLASLFDAGIIGLCAYELGFIEH